MALTNGRLVKATGAGSIADADLTGAVTTSGGLATTLATGLSPDVAALSLLAQKMQCFTVAIRNNAGTIQHCIVDGAITKRDAAFADKITGASSTFANTPTVGAGTDFTNGVGITSNIIVFNTADQDTTKLFAMAFNEYQDCTSPGPNWAADFVSRNVNGTTRERLELTGYFSQSGSAAWTINTTQIASGESIYIKVFAFLA